MLGLKLFSDAAVKECLTKSDLFTHGLFSLSVSNLVQGLQNTRAPMIELTKIEVNLKEAEHKNQETKSSQLSVIR